MNKDVAYIQIESGHQSHNKTQSHEQTLLFDSINIFADTDYNKKTSQEQNNQSYMQTNNQFIITDDLTRYARNVLAPLHSR